MIDFPFTDYKKAKIRPAIVLYDLEKEGRQKDLVIMAISSVVPTSPEKYDILISDRDTDFMFTGLKKSSLIKPNKIATIIKSRVVYRLGNLTPGLLDKLDTSLLALLQVGGRRIEKESILIPYGRQWIDDKDILEVIKALSSDWIAQGPKIEEFQKKVASYCGAKYGVAVSSGTAALHAAMYSAEIDSGDEVIVPPITFAATANAVVFQRGTPVFADIDPDTLLLDPNQVEAKITPRTKAIIAVDFAGQPCDYDALRAISDRHGLILVADACHALGAEYKRRKVGTLADLTIFSFHPVKHITTGEGGMVVTDNPDFAAKMCRFRNHGISTDHQERAEKGTWYYEMVDLGYNYRITDFQCALGLSQLGKLPGWIARRQEIAKRYDEAFANVPYLNRLYVSKDVFHVYHLYVIRLNLDRLKADRKAIFGALREQGIGVNVHYIPVHLHPFYRRKFGTKTGICPIAEVAYERIITLPIFPKMIDRDIEDVINVVRKLKEYYQE